MADFGIIGSAGRMGRALAEAIEEAGHKCAVGVDAGDDVALIADQCAVLVDFSAPAALEANLKAACDAGTPILTGTTGLQEPHFALIEAASRTIPLIQTGNTSLGVTLLSALVEEAASRLGSDWDIEVLEMHHRHKVDAPSGTAKLLGEAAAKARGIDLASNREAVRDGYTGKRGKGAIGFASLRGGSVVGDHSVFFAGEQETITLSHSASDRRIFARGAVRGGEWLIGQKPGRYTMEDVLGLARK